MRLPFREHAQRYLSYLIDFILPPLCPATGELVDQQGMIAPRYWEQLTFIHSPLCDQCGAPFSFPVDKGTRCGACLETPPSYNKHRSALCYNDASRALILKFKHGDQMHAAHCFTPWLKTAGADIISQSDIIIPVPLHYWRLLKRRYNQADIIAKNISNHYPHLTHLSNGLKRTRHTVPQGHKRAKDRKRNIAQAFACPTPSLIEGKSILIIDDVYTTGATLNECAKILAKNGAKAVYCLTVAKVVKDI